MVKLEEIVITNLGGLKEIVLLISVGLNLYLRGI